MFNIVWKALMIPKKFQIKSSQHFSVHWNQTLMILLFHCECVCVKWHCELWRWRLTLNTINFSLQFPFFLYLLSISFLFCRSLPWLLCYLSIITGRRWRKLLQMREQEEEYSFIMDVLNWFTIFFSPFLMKIYTTKFLLIKFCLFLSKLL